MDIDDAREIWFDLTPMQRRLLVHVERHIEREGFAPTLREMAAALRCSTDTARRMVHACQAAGALEYHGARAFRLKVRPVALRLIDIPVKLAAPGYLDGI